MSRRVPSWAGAAPSEDGAAGSELTDQQPRRVHSTCRLCANRCPILVDVDHGRATRVTGDPDAALYHGYTCRRGRSLPELLNDRNRLRRPMKRLPDGRYEAISTEQALDEVSATLRRIVDDYGPRSVALYAGTQVVQSPPAYGMACSLLEELGSSMFFSANTIDQPGKHVAAGMHGYWMAPAQAFDAPDVILWVGINPLVSYKGIPAGVPRDILTQTHARGGRTITIDPRRTETAKLSSLHLQPKPGEDATILAGMLRVILVEERYDRDFVAENVTGVEVLARTVERYTPEYVARCARIKAEDLVTAARWFADARRGYAVAGTGANMSGSHGCLVEYLVLCLDTLCGHYLRDGEAYKAPAPLAPTPRFRAQAWPPVAACGVGEVLKATGRAESLAGLSTADLPDEILYPGEGRIRALFNLGGNPVVAFPDQPRTVRALDALDLLVSFDVRMSQTARRSHYVFASTMCLEVPGVQTSSSATVGYANGYAGFAGPWAQYTPAVVDRPPDSDLIEEWEVFFEIAKRLDIEISWLPRSPFRIGPPSPRQIPTPKLDMSRRPSHDEIIELWTSTARVPLTEVKSHPSGALFEPAEPVLVGPKEPGWTGRLDVGNAAMMSDLAAIWSPESCETPGSGGQFRLLNRRMIQVNSCYNIEKVNRGIPYNPTFMNPLDLAALDLRDGDRILITSAAGSVQGIVQADDTVMVGTVSMSHCFGDAPEPNEDPAVNGSAVNRLNSVDFARDRYSGQPHMTNLAVSIRPLNGA